ncbi:MAG: hypothetical protein R2865_10535 [Deinococcales bacterium]
MYRSRAFELISIPDYLDGEKLSAIKHECVDGQVDAIAGASDKHNHINSS